MISRYEILTVPHVCKIRPRGIFGKAWAWQPETSEYHYPPLYIPSTLNQPSLQSRHDEHIFGLMGESLNISKKFVKIPNFIIKHFLSKNWEWKKEEIPYDGETHRLRFLPFAYTHYQGLFHFINEQAWFTYHEKPQEIRSRPLGFSNIRKITADADSGVVLMAGEYGQTFYILDEKDLLRIPVPTQGMPRYILAIDGVIEPRIWKEKGVIKIAYNIQKKFTYANWYMEYSEFIINKNNMAQTTLSIDYKKFNNITFARKFALGKKPDSSMSIQTASLLNNKLFITFFVHSLKNGTTAHKVYLIVHLNGDVHESAYALARDILASVSTETPMITLSANMFRNKPYYVRMGVQ